MGECIRIVTFSVIKIARPYKQVPNVRFSKPIHSTQTIRIMSIENTVNGPVVREQFRFINNKINENSHGNGN